LFGHNKNKLHQPRMFVEYRIFREYRLLEKATSLRISNGMSGLGKKK